MLFYKRLFKNTVLLCAAFSLLITVCVCLVSYHYVRNEFLINANSEIDRISENLEYHLLQVQGLPVLLQSNEALKSYVENDTPSSADCYKVFNYLHSTVNAVPNMRYNVAVSKIDDNNIISNNSTSRFDYYINSYNISWDEINEIMTDFRKNPLTNTATLLTTKNDTNYLIIFLCDRKSFENDYYIITVFDLNNILYTPSNNIFFLKNYDNLLYCSDRSVAENLGDKKFLSGYTAVSKSSTSPNLLGSLTYTVLIPKSQYFTLIYRFAIVLLPIVLLLFFLSYIISKKSSKKIYRPVEQLLSQVSDISPSGSDDEFKSIASTISSLSQQNAKYHDDMEKNQATMKNKFFHDLFTGFLSKEQIETGINQYLENIDKAFPLSVIIVSIPDNLSENSITSENDTYSINVLIYNLFKNAFSDSEFFNFIIISPLVYGIVMSTGDIDALRQKLKQTALKAEDTLNLNINSYIGESINSREDMPSAFFSTYTSYTARFGNNTQLVIDSANMSDIAIYPLELENKIFSACIGCQRTQLIQLLDFLFNKKTEAKDVSQNMNYYISTLFYSTCMRVLTHLNVSADEVFGSDYNIYLELRSCNSFVEIHDKLRDIFLGIIDYVSNIKASLKQQHYDDMLEFVNQNYNNPDFNLVSLAEYMNMSLAYVSKLFKRLTKYNFKEYLTKIRIEKGTELLVENPDMQIKEIANLVGYNNPEPFTKAFVQIHKVLPAEYLKKKGK